MQKNTITNNITTVQEICDLAGSIQRLAADLNIHQLTIERWRKCGIPNKYHLILAEKYGIFPIDLIKMNKRLRKNAGLSA